MTSSPEKRLVLVGTSYEHAPVGLRGRLHVDAPELGDVSVRLAGGGEAVVLATCNRVEFYLAARDAQAARGRALAELAPRAKLPTGALERITYVGEEAEAARHLLRVAAGLESPVTGEPQILGQVRQAHRLAAAAGATGQLLNRLFGHALHGGKRVRAETQLGASSGSHAAGAVVLARRQLGTLEARRILIVGAGAMGRLAAASFASARIADLVVASRTLANARALASRFGGRCVELTALDDELATADVVVSCTSSPQLVLTAQAAAAALSRRRGSPLVLVDLAVPRDLDPAIASLPTCSLYDVDDVAGGGETRTALRELRRAERIVAEELARFEAWRRGLEVAPAIASLRRHAEQIRARELARATRKLATLSPAEREAVEVMTAQMVNKLLHLPTIRVKDARTDADRVRYAAALRHLFALEEVA